MKYIIAIITVLTIYSCRPSRHRENIEVVFYPGLVEFNDTDSGIKNSIVEPDKVYTITSDDYTFLHDSLPSLTTQKLGEAISPCILLIKTDNSIYGIDANNALQNNNKAYSLSEKDAYKIKLIVHYYDYIDSTDLKDLKEIKKFGTPNNYEYCPSDPQKPTKQLVKLVLKEK